MNTHLTLNKSVLEAYRGLKLASILLSGTNPIVLVLKKMYNKINMPKKEDIIKELNFTYIIIAVVIALAILGFGAMNFISSQKNQQIEQMKLQQSQQSQQNMQNQTKQQAQQGKDEQTTKKQKLDTCLSTAITSYHDYWYGECKSRGLITDKCISLHDMTFAQYAKQNNISDSANNIGEYLNASSDFEKQQKDCSNCSLPQYNADVINKSLQDDKNLCIKLYSN